MLDIILSVCWPFLVLAAILWIFCTLCDGESPINIIGELLTYGREGKVRGTTVYPNRKIVKSSRPALFQRERLKTHSLNDKLEEIRHEKRLAKIKYCVLSGREEIVEREIKNAHRNRGDGKNT